MKHCPVCKTDVEDLYIGLCTKTNCTWEFEFMGTESTPETQAYFENKLQNAVENYYIRNGLTLENDCFVVTLSYKTILVSTKDLEQALSWYAANRAVAESGDGWRLPAFNELREIFRLLHLKGKGNFKDGHYWTSACENDTSAWSIDFSAGNKFLYCSKDNAFYVRLVQELQKRF
jgi:hypothetical protein